MDNFGWYGSNIGENSIFEIFEARKADNLYFQYEDRQLSYKTLIDVDVV